MNANGKSVMSEQGQPLALYNLSQDPGEEHDVAAGRQLDVHEGGGPSGSPVDVDLGPGLGVDALPAVGPSRARPGGARMGLYAGCGCGLRQGLYGRHRQRPWRFKSED